MPCVWAVGPGKDLPVLRPIQLTAFGHVQSHGAAAGTLERVDAGWLTVRSGRIALGNLGAPDECSPDYVAKLDVPIGSRPIALSLYRWPPVDSPDGSCADVAALSVGFSDQPIAEWTAWESQGDPVVVHVDFGLAALFDLADAGIANWIAEQDDQSILAPLWEYAGTPWFVWHDGVLAFRCGGGERGYGFWLGLDVNGQVAALVVDLWLLPLREPNP